MALTAKPTLTSLPLEIKQEIYSHLLLAQNALKFSSRNSHVDEISNNFMIRTSSTGSIASNGNTRRIGLNFPTALFRINRAISNESLHFFHRQNKFVLIETNAKAFKEFIFYNQSCLPIIHIKSTRRIQRHILKVRVKSILESETRLEKQKVAKFLLPGIYFAHFLHLIHEELHYMEGALEYATIEMEFRTASEGFEGNKRARNLLKGVQSLHERFTGSGFPEEFSHFNGELREVRMEIHGDISANEIGIIRSAMAHKWSSNQEIVARSVEAEEKGNNFRFEGQYMAAIYEYQLAMLFKQRLYWGIRSNDADAESFNTFLMARIYHNLNNSYVDSALGIHGAAYESARQARTAIRSYGPRDIVSEDDKLRIDFQMHVATADLGQVGVAIQGLKWSLDEYRHSNLVPVVRSKLEELEGQVRLAEEQTEKRLGAEKDKEIGVHRSLFGSVLDYLGG